MIEWLWGFGWLEMLLEHNAVTCKTQRGVVVRRGREACELQLSSDEAVVRRTSPCVTNGSSCEMVSASRGTAVVAAGGAVEA
jgi:hypothetical protein